MNNLHREKLKALMEEILREEAENILAETGSILAELVQSERYRKTGTAMPEKSGTGSRKDPAEETPAPFTRPGSPDPAGDGPLVSTIPSTDPGKPAASGESADPSGLYVYGIGANAAAGSLAARGIDGQPVYAVPFRDIAAIVHASPLTPYHSEDASVMRQWVLEHQNVLETAGERYGTIVPFGFDTIIMPDGGRSAQEVLIAWMDGEYDRVQKKIAKIRGKKEYGVQVFGSVPAMVARVTGTSETIRALQEEIKNTGPGRAYMVRQKLEQELKKGIESDVDATARTCHRKIAAACDDLKVEKIKKTNEKDTRMLLNYSCLVDDEKYPELGEVLESIEAEDGLSVRFTGPWPVYSFV